MGLTARQHRASTLPQSIGQKAGQSQRYLPCIGKGLHLEGLGDIRVPGVAFDQNTMVSGGLWLVARGSTVCLLDTCRFRAKQRLG